MVTTNDPTPEEAVTTPPPAAVTPGAVSVIIRHNVLLAAASGIIPVVLLDSAALAGVQLNLLNDLAKLYGVEFRADLGKAAIGTLLATVVPTALGGGLLGSMVFQAAVRAVPVVGPALRLLTQPTFNAAFTYALGKVFARHFASGGTFLTFDPAKAGAYFKEKFNEVRGKPTQTTAAAA